MCCYCMVTSCYVLITTENPYLLYTSFPQLHITMENNTHTSKKSKKTSVSVIGYVDNGQEVNSRTEQEATVKEVDELLRSL